MRPQPRRHASGIAYRAQLRELRLAVEPVARLGLERRRPRAEHPADVLGERGGETFLARVARRANGREDATAACMQLLVRRSARAQRELLDAIAREARVRVAVDEARDRRATAAVDLHHVAVDRPEVAHASRRRDAPGVAEHVAVARHVDRTQRLATQRRAAPRGRRDLREISNQELRRAHGPWTEGRSTRVLARSRRAHPRSRRLRAGRRPSRDRS